MCLDISRKFWLVIGSSVILFTLFALLMGVLKYRRISQMTYQPKSVGIMADFETLTFVSRCLNSSQICNYFYQDLVTGYCPYLVKFDSLPSSAFKLILLPTPCCYGLDVT